VEANAAGIAVAGYHHAAAILDTMRVVIQLYKDTMCITMCIVSSIAAAWCGHTVDRPTRDSYNQVFQTVY